MSTSKRSKNRGKRKSDIRQRRMSDPGVTSSLRDSLSKSRGTKKEDEKEAFLRAPGLSPKTELSPSTRRKSIGNLSDTSSRRAKSVTEAHSSPRARQVGESTSDILPSDVTDSLPDSLRDIKVFEDDKKDFIRLTKDGSLEVSRNFIDALTSLYKVSPKGKMYSLVVTALEKIKQGEKISREEDDALQTLIEYQIFRKGDHLRTKDEEDWTEKITLKVLEAHPELPKLMFDDEEQIKDLAALVRKKANNDKQELTCTVEEISRAIQIIRDFPDTELSADLGKKGLTKKMVMDVMRDSLRELIKPLIAENYMCQCRYSAPSPTLLRRDIPTFVRERLRVKEMGSVPVHIFPTKNGYSIAYDPHLLGLKATQRYTVEQLAEKSSTIKEFLSNYKEPNPLPRKGLTIELVPFNSRQFMLAEVQVPVMDDSVEITLTSAARKPVPLKIGKKPEEVGIRMSSESAGVFKRSLNSQRVIEIADWDDLGNKVVFQLKGSGVPAYGFMKDQDWSGGEYFALTIEKGAMLFQRFVNDLFDIKDAVPTMVGVAMTSDADVATNEESAGRFGAVSFRLDYSMGVRLSNMLYESVKPEINKRYSLETDTKEWKNSIVRTLARNMALVNLFGLQYNDSGVDKLVDVGMRGEFADTGGLWNLDKAPKIEEMALVKGIKSHIKDGYSTEAFDKPYIFTMLQALENIAKSLEKDGDGEKAKVLQEKINIFSLYKKHVERLEKSIKPASKWTVKGWLDRLFEMQLSLLTKFVKEMGGDDKGPTVCQRAYETNGIKGFAQVIIDKMSTDNFGTWMQEIIVDKTTTGQLGDIIQALNIKSDKELKEIMGLKYNDPWPKLNSDQSFEERLATIKWAV